MTEKTIVTLVIAGVCGLGFTCALVPWLDDLLLTAMILAAVVGVAVFIVKWRHVNHSLEVTTTHVTAGTVAARPHPVTAPVRAAAARSPEVSR